MVSSGLSLVLIWCREVVAQPTVYFGEPRLHTKPVCSPATWISTNLEPPRGNPPWQHSKHPRKKTPTTRKTLSHDFDGWVFLRSSPSFRNFCHQRRHCDLSHCAVRNCSHHQDDFIPVPQFLLQFLATDPRARRLRERNAAQGNRRSTRHPRYQIE